MPERNDRRDDRPKDEKKRDREHLSHPLLRRRALGKRRGELPEPPDESDLERTTLIGV